MTIEHCEAKDESPAYGTIKVGFDTAMNWVNSNNWYIRDAFLGYEVNYDTKQGVWKYYVRFSKIDRDKVAIEGPALPSSIGGIEPVEQPE